MANNYDGTRKPSNLKSPRSRRSSTVRNKTVELIPSTRYQRNFTNMFLFTWRCVLTIRASILFKSATLRGRARGGGAVTFRHRKFIIRRVQLPSVRIRNGTSVTYPGDCRIVARSGIVPSRLHHA